MHYLDDKPAMDVMLMERPDAFMCIAKLLVAGGTGFLHPVSIAKALRTHTTYVEHAIKQLLSTLKIEKGDAPHKYSISRFGESSYAKAHPVSEVVHVEIGAPTPPPEPDKIDYAVVADYHKACKVGGPYREAAEAVMRLRAKGWSVDDLRAAIVGYKKSGPGMYRNAKSFFEMFGGELFFGAQYIDNGKLAIAGKEAPKVVDAIEETRRLMAKQKEVAH